MNIEQKLQSKLNSLLKLTETIDVVPPIIPRQENVENISELIKKQTEMIIDIIKTLVDNQNKLIIELINTQKQISPNVENKFQEKVITLNYDSTGNPISANVKLKTFDENKLDLATLESQETIEIEEGDIL
jgi:hypothetical protein